MAVIMVVLLSVVALVRVLTVAGISVKVFLDVKALIMAGMPAGTVAVAVVP